MAAGADLVALKDELQSSRIKRWHAVGMLKHVLLCLYLPLELKKDAINFLLSIMYAKLSQMPNDENEDYSTYMPTLCSALQVAIWCLQFQCTICPFCVSLLTVEAQCRLFKW